MKCLFMLIIAISLPGCTGTEIKLGPNFLNATYKACNSIPSFVRVNLENLKVQVICSDGKINRFTAETND